MNFGLLFSKIWLSGEFNWEYEGYLAHLANKSLSLVFNTVHALNILATVNWFFPISWRLALEREFVKSAVVGKQIRCYETCWQSSGKQLSAEFVSVIFFNGSVVVKSWEEYKGSEFKHTICLCSRHIKTLNTSSNTEIISHKQEWKSLLGPENKMCKRNFSLYLSANLQHFDPLDDLKTSPNFPQNCSLMENARTDLLIISDKVADCNLLLSTCHVHLLDDRAYFDVNLENV